MSNSVMSKVNKNLRPRVGNTQIGGFLYNNGISYHDYGTVATKGNNVRLFDYYAVDKLTDKQRQIIRDNIPMAIFRVTACQYAPEIKKGLILIPKLAYYRQMVDQEAKCIK